MIKLKDGFSQVCVWPACIVVTNDNDESKENEINTFEKFMFDQFKVRVQYLEEIKTKPDHNGEIVKGTGNRNDLFFAVHNEDIGRFAVPRLTAGIRWIEDTLAIDNYKCHIYPDRVFKYVTWNEEHIKFPDY